MPRARAKVFHTLNHGKNESAIALTPSVAHLARAVDRLNPMGLVAGVELSLPGLDLICVLSMYRPKKNSRAEAPYRQSIGHTFFKVRKKYISSS